MDSGLVIEVTFKALRDGAGAQEAVPLVDVTTRVADKLAQSLAQNQTTV